jgi:hypothetical protein
VQEGKHVAQIKRGKGWEGERREGHTLLMRMNASLGRLISSRSSLASVAPFLFFRESAGQFAPAVAMNNSNPAFDFAPRWCHLFSSLCVVTKPYDICDMMMRGTWRGMLSLSYYQSRDTSLSGHCWPN